MQNLWDSIDHKGMSLCIAQYCYSFREFEMVLVRECWDSLL